MAVQSKPHTGTKPLYYVIPDIIFKGSLPKSGGHYREGLPAGTLSLHLLQAPISLLSLYMPLCIHGLGKFHLEHVILGYPGTKVLEHITSLINVVCSFGL